MKKIFVFVNAVLLTASLCAQAPQKMSYQAVIRGENNALVVDKTIGIKISILQGSETGSTVYSELHSTMTNSNGVAVLSIGSGKNISGDFAKIEWSKGSFFAKTETDLAGGTNYKLTSVSELMSVPYALYAANSQPGPKGDKGATGLAGKDGQPGPKGEKGETGLPGIAGKDGLPGITGDVGIQGLAGKDGTKGLKGDKGDPGIQGPAGKNGLKGLKGDPGLQGLPGIKSNDQQKISVSIYGDTLYLQNGGSVIIPGLSVLNHKTTPTSGYGPNITDIDGNTYKTVYIGKQQWMAENLKTTKFNDGTIIPNIIDSAQWMLLNTPAWSFYKNDISNNAKYGRLYNWYAVSTITNGNKNLCPTGWHAPSDSELIVLIDYLGGKSDAGGKLKEEDTTNWISPNVDASNSSLFTALPGGFRSFTGEYLTIRERGHWWSTTESFSNYSIALYLYYGYGAVYKDVLNNKMGLSVRCLRD